MSAGLLTAALTETAIVTWRELSAHHDLPLPSSYAAVAIVYGGLGLFPDSASGFAAAVGWGLVLATFLNLWNPASGVKLATPKPTQGAATP